MCQDLVPIWQFYLEHCIGQRLYDGTFQLNYVVFSHVSLTFLGQCFGSRLPRWTALSGYRCWSACPFRAACRGCARRSAPQMPYAGAFCASAFQRGAFCHLQAKDIRSSSRKTRRNSPLSRPASETTRSDTWEHIITAPHRR